MNRNAAGAETRPPVVVAWFHWEGRCPHRPRGVGAFLMNRNAAGAETRPPDCCCVSSSGGSVSHRPGPGGCGDPPSRCCVVSLGGSVSHRPWGVGAFLMNRNAAGTETRPPVVAWFHWEGRCPTDRELSESF